MRMPRSLLLALCMSGCVGGVELPPEESVPVLVERAMVVGMSQHGLELALSQASLSLSAAHPTGYPLVIPESSHYDPKSDTALVYGPATTGARIVGGQIEPDIFGKRLLVTLTLDDVVLDVPAHDASGGAGCTVAVTLLEPRVHFALHSSRSKVGNVEIFQSGDVLVEAEDMHVPADCALKDQEASALVRERVEEAVRSQLASAFVATMTPLLRKAMVFRLPPGRRITVPSPSGEPGALSHRLVPPVGEDGAPVLDVTGPLTLLTVSLAAKSERNGCVPVGALVPMPEPDAPLFGEATPVGGDPFDAAVAISAVALRQALVHTWNAGLLCDSVGTSKAPDFTTDSFGDTLPLLSAIAPSSPVWLRFWPSVPPTASLGAKGSEPGGLSLQAFFPSLEMEIYADVEETRLLVYRLTGAVSVTLRPALGAPIDGAAPLGFAVESVACDGLTLSSPLLSDIPAISADEAASIFRIAIEAWLQKGTLLSVPVGSYEPLLLEAVNVGAWGVLYLGLTPSGSASSLGPLMVEPQVGAPEAEAQGCHATSGSPGAAAGLLALGAALLARRRRRRV